MSDSKSNQDDPDLKAIVEWEPTPDAESRWAAALDMLFNLWHYFSSIDILAP
jgi:hypothetical protein